MRLSILLVLAAAPSVFGAWGDICDGINHHGDEVAGVCVRTGQCKPYRTGKRVGTLTNGRCPNDPEDVKCCWSRGCVQIAHGRCPGGANVKCAVKSKRCMIVENGKCPGGNNYKYGVGLYKGGKVRC